MIYINNLNAKVTKNKKKYLSIINEVFNSGMFTNGKHTNQFETNLKNYLDARHCLSCANGTDALEITFKALGLKRGDHVFIAANSGMYSSVSLMQIGITPSFFDIDKYNYGPSIKEIRKLPKKTKAIVITHLYGKCNEDIFKIKKFCEERKIILIEDCAQAIGAKLNNKFAGTFGKASTFSFFPTKNLGAFGDAGAIIFKNKKTYEKAKMIKQYGWKQKYEVALPRGQNSRMDEIQAALLNYELKNLDHYNNIRLKIAKIYKKNINNKKIFVPKIHNNSLCNYHLFVIFVKNRNSLIKFLKKNEIIAQVHYPIPDFKQKIFSKKIQNLNLKNSIETSKEVLSLPCYPELKFKDVIKITKIINSWKA